jgi:hypothetical protein
MDKRIAQKELRLPEPLPTLNTVVENPKEYVPVCVLTRGNSGSPEDKVGMRPLGVLLPDGAPELDDKIPGARIALAK